MNFLVIIILVFLFNNFKEGQLVLIPYYNYTISTNSLSTSKQEILNTSKGIDLVANKYFNQSITYLSLQNITNKITSKSRDLQSNHITINTNPEINSKYSFCESINDCFNCTMYSQLDVNCKWSGYKCSNSESFINYANWWEYFKPCTLDSAAYNKMRNYCGGILERAPPMTAELVNINGVYGTKFLYCRWNLLNNDINKYIFLNFTKYSGSLDDEYAIEIFYSDGYVKRQNLLYQDYQFEDIGVENIYFHYFSSQKKNDLPFSMSMNHPNEKTKDYVAVFVSLGIIVFICLFCSLLFYKCSRIIIENSNRRLQERLPRVIFEEIVNINSVRNNINNELQAQVETQRREEETKKFNMMKLNLLFERDLKSILYNREVNDFEAGGSCTICLEEFKDNQSIVIKLFCKHIFHVKCLKNWCFNTILNPKCPNCNFSILPNENEILTINSTIRTRFSIRVPNIPSEGNGADRAVSSDLESDNNRRLVQGQEREMTYVNSQPQEISSARQPVRNSIHRNRPQVASLIDEENINNLSVLNIQDIQGLRERNLPISIIESGEELNNNNFIDSRIERRER